MSDFNNISPKNVFKYFQEISAIPRGSGNMAKIADYCMAFAKKHALKAIKDNANNVIIYKNATKGYENSEPVILQGHLDMVCQKTAESDIDFLKEGLSLFVDGDFLKAKNTTLGADNGIAVAIVLSILESEDISHPAIEAVFTTDEETGMIGASRMDMSVLKSRKMLNLDSEELDTVTVSCAGGSEFNARLPFERKSVIGTKVDIILNGLKGGHSGICINEGRVNANTLAGRFLNYLNNTCDFDLISVNGGNKSNAIPLCCEIKLCCNNALALKSIAEEYLNKYKEEISFREPDFHFEISVLGEETCECIEKEVANNVIYSLLCAPNSVIEMSAEIEGLVETSLNLGILETGKNNVDLTFALRSNKKTALKFLEEKLFTFFSKTGAKTDTSGYYPPWEFNANSTLQTVYKEAYLEQFGCEPKVEAIHAGLECGVFADVIENFDCISIGPEIYDVHTVNERLSISSTEQFYKLVIKILEKCQ